MIYNALEKIVQEENSKGTRESYILVLLKEYLQAYVLYFIYTASDYQKNLVFTGGTCLRHFYGLERLSEDLDFGCSHPIAGEQLQQDLVCFFKKRYQYESLKVTSPQKGRQLLLKFPVLHNLGLAASHQSDLLHVKLDLADRPSEFATIETTAKSIFGFNFVAKHYDLPTLMAGKIHAVLMRSRKIGKENSETVKGRDYFDLLWFLKKGVLPNMKRLTWLLQKQMTLAELMKQLDQKVAALLAKHKEAFKNDLIPFVLNADVIPDYVENYREEYERYAHPLL